VTGAWAASWARLVDCRPGEGRALFWSFAGFFLLLAGYYVLRPVREEMGVQIGPDKLQWAFTLTLAGMLAIVPLYGWAAARLPRRACWRRSSASRRWCWPAFRPGSPTAPRRLAALALFVWVSVFNLVVVSCSGPPWPTASTHAQARRLFGMIAAGGSSGALVGPTITALSVHAVGVHGLLLVSAALILLSLLCILRVVDDHTRAEAGRPLGGRFWPGWRRSPSSPYLAMIALAIVLQSVVGTFVYFEQARLVKAAALAPEARTQLFALIDLAVNLLALGLQALVAGRLMQKLGVGITLAAVPLLLAGAAGGAGGDPGAEHGAGHPGHFARRWPWPDAPGTRGPVYGRRRAKPATRPRTSSTRW
jgi:AAA family ATP:ADP antiporter